MNHAVQGSATGTGDSDGVKYHRGRIDWICKVETPQVEWVARHERDPYNIVTTRHAIVTRSTPCSPTNSIN